MVDKIVEENIETVIEMTVMTEADVQTIVDPGQDPELAQIGIEYIVISAGNTIILQGTVPLLRKRKKLNSSNA